MHRGYIKLWRKISDNPLWTDTKFTPGQAWVDLILLANHKPGHIRVRGIKIDIQRGVCGWSQVALAERWKWSRGKVIRFLNELETSQQIEQQKNNVTSLIKIKNYNDYQANNTADRTADGQQTEQQTDSKRYTNKNDKDDKNDKNDNIPPQPPKGAGSEKPKTWKTDFHIYLEQCERSYRELTNDIEWIANQERINPNIDILLTMEKSKVNYWGTQDAWEKKKRQKIQDINWKSTWQNALSMAMNRVYKDAVSKSMQSKFSTGCRITDQNMQAAKEFIEDDTI